MEELCRICRKQGNQACICDRDLHFCYKHAMKHLKTLKGYHKMIELRNIEDRPYKKYKLALEKINQTSNDLICRSNTAKNLKYKSANIEQRLDENNLKIVIDKNLSVPDMIKKLNKDKIFLEGHMNPILQIEITSDNKYIISGSSDKQFESEIL